MTRRSITTETVAFWAALRLLLAGPYSFSCDMIAEEVSAGTDIAEDSAGQGTITDRPRFGGYRLDRIASADG